MSDKNESNIHVSFSFVVCERNEFTVTLPVHYPKILSLSRKSKKVPRIKWLPFLLGVYLVPPVLSVTMTFIITFNLSSQDFLRLVRILESSASSVASKQYI